MWEIAYFNFNRSYLNHFNIQLAIYDDRLEITSPGKLPVGQSIDRMKKGYSQVRNKGIANAFYYMKLMENWGSGIPRIIESVVTAGLQEPEFIDGDIDLRINIYRGPKVAAISDHAAIKLADNADKMPAKCRQSADNVDEVPIKCRQSADKVPTSEQEQQIYNFVLENMSVTTVQAMKLLHVKQRRARNVLAKMAEEKWLRKEGLSKSTVYVLNAENE